MHVLELGDASPENDPTIRLLSLTVEEVTARCRIANERFLRHSERCIHLLLGHLA